VMMVKSADPGLLAHAQQYALVRSKADLHKLGLTLSVPGLALKRSDKHVYLQSGFGFTSNAMSDSDSYVGKFQVRFADAPITVVVAEEVYSFDEETGIDDVHSNVVRLTANNTNSSAPGDSGGPLFLLDSTSTGNGPPDVYLLGVTLGANQSLIPRTPVPDEPILVNSSNYVSAYLCERFPGLQGC